MRRRLFAATAVLAALALTVVPASTGPVAEAAPPSSRSSQPACPSWPMYGQNPARTFSTDCESGITPASVATLIPAWVLDTRKPVTATPAVVDGVVYIGSWERVMYALDADTGAELWATEVPAAPGATYGPIVSSAAVVDVAFHPNGIDDVRRLVLFGAGPLVYALDAADGTVAWVHDASEGIPDTPTEYESSPVVIGDLVLIGRDTHNEEEALTGGVRGGLVALDVRTGEEVWVFEPELDQPGQGCGGVWSSPTVDTVLDQVYVGTANCPVDGYPWTPHVNAVTALRLVDGTPVWSFQPYSASAPDGHPDDDTDFGATPNLFTDASGRRVLGAGKKDGTYYALDPATGALLWSTKVVEPAPNIGGFIGSPAVADGRIFGGTAISTPLPGELPHSFHALDGETGEVAWQGGVGPTYGASAEVNGVVFNAALDDLLKAYHAETGALLWAAPLLGPGSSGPVVAGDMVFVGSGTSTSDACGKDNVYDQACFFFFDAVLAELGGIQAFRLATSAAGGADPSPSPSPDPGENPGGPPDGTAGPPGGGEPPVGAPAPRAAAVPGGAGELARTGDPGAAALPAALGLGLAAALARLAGAVGRRTG